MIKLYLFLLLSCAALIQASGNEIPMVKTVENVDIEKYMGRWYEIERIPNSFQKNCIGNVRADYTLKKDGKVRVVNSCLEEGGEEDTAKGIAKVFDEETKARLKVSFVSLFGIQFFWGDYWILYLDENYQNAVVGDPSRKYGWILSRKTKLTSEELEPVYEALGKNGYDTDDFVPTKQNIKDLSSGRRQEK